MRQLAHGSAGEPVVDLLLERSSDEDLREETSQRPQVVSEEGAQAFVRGRDPGPGNQTVAGREGNVR